MSLLVICKILGLFVNTLIANYSLLNRDNLSQLLQMQLSQKQKKFSKLFCAFSISVFNFEHFQRKDDAYNEITDSEKCG